MWIVGGEKGKEEGEREEREMSNVIYRNGKFLSKCLSTDPCLKKIFF